MQNSLDSWLTYLENIHTSAIDLGLERVAKVAQAAELTKPAPYVITVAGTNGKGSTCALLEAILIHAGYKVGVYSSPHLIAYNERVRLQGEQVSDTDLCASFERIEAAREDTSLSFFEFGTLAALDIFKQKQVDVAILEVGLGGRLDATNVVDHDVSVITSLALDHIDWLGDDINVIGYEKAGIFRSNKPAVCGQPSAPATVAAHADDIGATLYQVGYQFNYHINSDGKTWHWQAGVFDLAELPLPNLPLMNAATALMALGASSLDVSDLDIIYGLENAKLAGRMQQVSDKPLVFLDVAHNPHAAGYLVAELNRRFLAKKPDQKIHAVLGMLKDKDIEATIEVLAPAMDSFYLTSLTGPRAADAEHLAQYLDADKIAAKFDTPYQAYQAAMRNMQEDDILLVLGSFHTVGDVLAKLNQHNR